MTAPAISCEAYVAGVRLADTAASWAQRTPTALSGLSMTWGRSGPQAQPDIATCSLTVADADGDTEFLGLLNVGAWLDVYAGATISTGAPADVAVDPGFATPLGMRVYTPGSMVFADDPARDAIAPPGHSCKCTPTAASNVTAPVAPFTTHPGGWITIPAIEPGSTWQVSLRVRCGPIADPNLTWRLQGITESTAAQGVPLGSFAPVNGVAGGYVTVGGAYTAPSDLAPGYKPGILVQGVRPITWAQVPAGLTWAQLAAGPWTEVGCVWLDEFHAIAPALTHRRAQLFTGRITDLAASAMGGAAVQVEITAVDWPADLANQNIGDVPWPAERLDLRVGRIAALAIGGGLLVAIDPRCAAPIVSWVDIDSQPLYALIEDLAVTGDGILWAMGTPAANRTLWIEDPDTRASVGSLGPDPGSGLITVLGGRPTGGILLDSCDVNRDEVALQQTVEDVIARVTLTWQNQTLDDGGLPAPTDVTLTSVDDAAQTAYGPRELSVSTQLTTAADAQTIADRKLARSRALAWHAAGMTWDTRVSAPLDVDHVNAAITLLDLSARVGLLVTITDVPAWFPINPDLSAFLEGGTYTYTDGRWVLGLGLAPSGISGGSAGWAELDPAWTWVKFDPGVAWSELWGVDSSYTKEAA